MHQSEQYEMIARAEFTCVLILQKLCIRVLSSDELNQLDILATTMDELSVTTEEKKPVKRVHDPSGLLDSLGMVGDTKRPKFDKKMRKRRVKKERFASWLKKIDFKVLVCER